MRVPVYDNLQTGIAATNGAQVRNQDVGAIGEIGARQAAQMGQVLGNAGDALGQVVLQRQALVNEADAKQVDIETDRQVREVLKGQDGYLNQQGGNAIAAYEDTRRKIADIYAHAGDALGNDDARQMWNGVAAQREATAMDMIDTHHGQQQQKYVIDTTDARIRHESEGLADSLNDPKAYDVHMGIILTEAAHMSALLGETDPLLIEQRKQAYLAAAHAGVINHLLATNQPTVAFDYYKSHKDDFPKGAQSGFEKTLTEASSASLALSNADEAVKLYGPKALYGTFDTEKIDAWAREHYGNDAAGLSLFRHEIEFRVQNHAFNSQQIEAHAVEVVSSVFAKKGIAAARLLPEWQQLRPQTQARLENPPRSSWQGQARAAAKVPGPASERESQSVLGNMTNDDLNAATPNEFKMLFGRFPAVYDAAIKRKEALKNPPIIPEDVLTHVLRAAGLYPGSKNPRDQQQIGLARFLVNSRVQQAQGQSNRLLSRQEIIDYANAAAAETIQRDIHIPLIDAHVSYAKNILQVQLSDFSAEQRAWAQHSLEQRFAKSHRPEDRPTQDNMRLFLIDDARQRKNHTQGGQ